MKTSKIILLTALTDHNIRPALLIITIEWHMPPLLFLPNIPLWVIFGWEMDFQSFSYFGSIVCPA